MTLMQRLRYSSTPLLPLTLALNALLGLSGLALVVYGFIQLMREENLTSAYMGLLDSGPFLVLFGLIVVAGEALALYCALKRDFFAMVMICVFNFLIVSLKLFMMGVLFASVVRVEGAVVERLRAAMEATPPDDMDALQAELHCCGVQGPWDYASLPPSCCSKRRACFPEYSFEKGCATHEAERVKLRRHFMGGFLLACALLRMINMPLLVGVALGADEGRRDGKS